MDLTVRTVDGVHLSARHLTPDVPSGTGVVVVHGFTGTQDQAEVRAVVDALLLDGHDVWTFDGRGHGRSEGRCTLGDLERLDVAAVADEARRHHDQIVLLGASMGAVAVLGYAAMDPDIAGVVAVSSPAVWRTPRTLRGLISVPITRTRLGQRFARRVMHVRLARRWTWPDPPSRLVERVQAPVAFIHGRQDPFIHPDASVQLHAHDPARWRLDLVEDMAHAYDPVGIPAVRAAVAWILQAREALGAPGAATSTRRRGPARTGNPSHH